MVFCALILLDLSHLCSCGYLCDCFLYNVCPSSPPEGTHLKEPSEGRYQECFPTSVFSRFSTESECIMRNAGLEEAQAGIKIAGRNINNLRYADDTTLMAESEEELKSLLMKVKVESEKIGLKLNVQKMKIMASGAITSWEIEGETVETVSDFFWGAPKSLKMVIAAMKLKDAYSLEGKL